MTHSTSALSLPIDTVLDELMEHLAQQHCCILQAEPGAGKTTRVPLALLKQDWLADQKIILLEPRRIAARNAAEFMASALGEKCGQTVGYRMRQDTNVSSQTRIEVVTEGVFSRMLLDDPSLAGVGLVIFDEFHERNLDSDVALALCLQANELFRDDHPLKLLVMSATLELASLSDVLQCPLVSCGGRNYPIDVIYTAQASSRDSVVANTCALIEKAVIEQQESILVFLAGQFEIDAVYQQLQSSYQQRSDLMLCPLYGMLSLQEQRKAIEPSPQGIRKIVLATNIAESSLTIDGVSVVIDSGWARVSRFDPRTAMSRLHTQRISQAASIQRAGRAGRLGPGVCYRLWTEQQQSQLNQHDEPDILQADLMPLVMLMLAWGVAEVDELMWVTPPPQAAFNSARSLLFTMGLLSSDDSGASLTTLGQKVGQLPVHPRFGLMLIRAGEMGVVETAAKLITLLEERDPIQHSSVDLELRLAWLDKPGKHTSRYWQRIKRLTSLVPNSKQDSAISAAEILALAFPDRIAQRRGTKLYEYKLAHGRGVQLPEGDSLSAAEYIVVADLGGHAGNAVDRIYLALQLESTSLKGTLAHLVKEVSYNEWDDKTESIIAEQRDMIGALVINRQKRPQPNADQVKLALLHWIVKKGLTVLNWSEQAIQLRSRIMIAQTVAAEHSDWPSMDEQALLTNLEQWLWPYLDGVTSAKQLQKVNVYEALKSQLDWQQQQYLDALLPKRIGVPTGREVEIDYSGDRPILAVKMQEMFGCPATPRIANGKLGLTVHLLSPAQRPLAVTADLASFWQNAYHDVKKDMKGRYPKHYWPDDPLQAAPTKFVKSRM